jgi:Domain of unknown function (DUF4260)
MNASTAPDSSSHEHNVGLSPVLLLRLEGLAWLALAVAGYAWLHGTHGGPGWGVFAAAFLAPDVAMLGYLVSKRVGAMTYNMAHTETVPAVLLALAAWLHHPMLGAVALIWLAHIGFDRAAGYGLKYATAFGHTHLGTVGRGRKATEGSPSPDGAV